MGSVDRRVGGLAMAIFAGIAALAGLVALPLALASTSALFALYVMATLAGVAVAVCRPVTGFFIYLGCIQVVDFLKRLLLAFGNPSPTEWFGTILLPDLILAAVAITCFGGGSRRMAAPLAPRARLVAVCISLYAGWYTVRSLWTAGPLVNAIGKWKLVVPYVLCFFLARYLVRTKEQFWKVLKLHAVFLTLAAVYGFWQVAFGLNSFEQRWLFEGYTALAPSSVLYAEGIPRAFSFYSDHAGYAYLLATVSTLLLFSRRAVGVRFWNSVGVIVILLAALLSTVTRSGWVFMAFGSVIYIATIPKAKFLRVALLIGSTALIVLAIDRLVVIGGTTGSDVIERATTAGTYSDRLASFQNLVDYHVIENVWGRGVASIPGQARDISGVGLRMEFIIHDFMTESIYEVGWIGFGLFIAAIFLLFRVATPTFLGGFAPGMKAVIVGFVLVWLGSGAVPARSVLTLFWLCMGLLCSSDARQGASLSPAGAVRFPAGRPFPALVSAHGQAAPSTLPRAGIRGETPGRARRQGA